MDLASDPRGGSRRVRAGRWRSSTATRPRARPVPGPPAAPAAEPVVAARSRRRDRLGAWRSRADSARWSPRRNRRDELAARAAALAGRPRLRHDRPAVRIPWAMAHWCRWQRGGLGAGVGVAVGGVGAVCRLWVAELRASGRRSPAAALAATRRGDAVIAGVDDGVVRVDVLVPSTGRVVAVGSDVAGGCDGRRRAPAVASCRRRDRNRGSAQDPPPRSARCGRPAVLLVRLGGSRGPGAPLESASMPAASSACSRAARHPVVGSGRMSRSVRQIGQSG